MMDTISAFARAEASRGQPRMVFDWVKAAQLIAERQPQEASAGLSGDWEWTGGPIYQNGQPVPKDETYVYLASTWAVPELEINGEIIPCYVTHPERSEWDAHTYWPEDALAVLRKENV